MELQGCAKHTFVKGVLNVSRKNGELIYFSSVFFFFEDLSEVMQSGE